MSFMMIGTSLRRGLIGDSTTHDTSTQYGLLNIVTLFRLFLTLFL